MHQEFTVWLSNHLDTAPQEVQRLLSSKLARNFLIVWSIYESKCFEGFVNPRRFEKFTADNTDFVCPDLLDQESEYFHIRYQNHEKRRNLLHSNNNAEFERIVNSQLSSLTVQDKVFLLLFVTYRYRNNIFHGNKGIQSWLQFEEQINRCIVILQHFIDVKLNNTPRTT